MNRLIGLLATLALSAPAFALDGVPGSAFLHNAAGHKTEVSLALGYISVKKTTEEGQFFKGFKGTGMEEAFKAEYGFNNNLSAGLYLANYSVSVTPDPENNGFFGKFTDKGMLDPQLFVHYRMDLGPGSLRAGLMLNISGGTHTMANDLGENAYAGATSIAPWVGYEAVLTDQHTFGGKLTYQMYIGDRKFHRDATAFYAAYDSTGQGGQQTQVDAFYEYSITGSFLVGADLNYTNTATTKETVNGTQTDDTNGSAGLGYMVLAGWARAISDTTFVVVNPFVQINNGGMNGMDANTKSSSQTTAGVAGMLLF